MLLRLPRGVAFVTTAWVAQTIAKRERQPEGPFLPACLTPAPPAPAPAPPAAAEAAGDGGQAVGSQGQEAQQEHRQQAGEQQQQQHLQQPPAPELERASSVASICFNEEELRVAQQDTLQPPAMPSVAAEGGTEQQQQQQGQQQRGQQLAPCRVERRGSEFVAVRGVKPQYTGGRTGIPWGSCGVWAEPFDPDAARQASMQAMFAGICSRVCGGDGGGQQRQTAAACSMNISNSHIPFHLSLMLLDSLCYATTGRQLIDCETSGSALARPLAMRSRHPPPASRCGVVSCQPRHAVLLHASLLQPLPCLLRWCFPRPAALRSVLTHALCSPCRSPSKSSHSRLLRQRRGQTSIAYAATCAAPAAPSAWWLLWLT